MRRGSSEQRILHRKVEYVNHELLLPFREFENGDDDQGDANRLEWFVIHVHHYVTYPSKHHRKNGNEFCEEEDRDQEERKEEGPAQNLVTDFKERAHVCIPFAGNIFCSDKRSVKRSQIARSPIDQDLWKSGE
jgi:hypothetical protein